MIISKSIDVVLKDKTNKTDGIKLSRFIYIGKPIFKGEIVDRQDKYDRKTDSITFKAQYNGKID